MTAPAPLGGRPGGRGGRFQSRRARLILALTGGLLALLCVGGVGAFIVLYDEATEIKRDSPGAVVTSFLGAYLSNRNDQEAAFYQCQSGVDLSALQAFRDDTVQREQQFSVGIAIRWRVLSIATNGTTSIAKVEVNRRISDGSGRDGSSWDVTLEDQNGWRVCGAQQTS
ncbi:hypothetical protein AB0G04_00575 [Actinoplanes sp. NPDC023801]|uniref:hypothetical protein n=1 Tax=Actinoplanes sp. NPDC023801 TaxID=3154595 RepID=UPI0033DB2289